MAGQCLSHAFQSRLWALDWAVPSATGRNWAKSLAENPGQLALVDGPMDGSRKLAGAVWAWRPMDRGWA